MYTFLLACLLAFFLDNERLARAWAATYRGVKELQNVLRVGKTNEKKGRYHGHRTRVYGQKNGYACAALREQSSTSQLLCEWLFFSFLSTSASPIAYASSGRVSTVRRSFGAIKTEHDGRLCPNTGWTGMGTTSAPRNVPHAITETIDVDTH